MIVLPLFLALLCSVAESRVTFSTSEVLDDVDLKGPSGTTATFKCTGGCRVYSPTRNANLIVQDSAGKKFRSLMDLADLQPGTPYDLEANTNAYTLKNAGPADPSFVFYVVQKGAANYDTKVLYVSSDPASKRNVKAETGSTLTVMSATGAIRFSSFTGDFSDALPAVYTVPADSISSASCRPVYEAISTASIAKTSFPVYSPIATINFKKAGGGKSVVISGEYGIQTSTGQDASALYSSPGYVGCTNVGDSLYTFLSPITSFDSYSKVTDSNGLSVVVNGDYNIEKEADGIQLTINDDKKTLYGNKPYYVTQTATSFAVSLKWEKRAGSKDRFAMQIDVMSGSANRVSTTTKSGSLLTIGSSLFMILSAAVFRL